MSGSSRAARCTSTYGGLRAGAATTSGRGGARGGVPSRHTGTALGSRHVGTVLRLVLNARAARRRNPRRAARTPISVKPPRKVHMKSKLSMCKAVSRQSRARFRLVAERRLTDEGMTDMRRLLVVGVLMGALVTAAASIAASGSSISEQVLGAASVASSTRFTSTSPLTSSSPRRRSRPGRASDGTRTVPTSRSWCSPGP